MELNAHAYIFHKKASPVYVISLITLDAIKTYREESKWATPNHTGTKICSARNKH